MNISKIALEITTAMAGAGLLAVLAAFVAPTDSRAMDNPHNKTGCATCHQSGASAWWTDQAASGGLCGQCHYQGSAIAPDAMAHTASATYGGVTKQCTDCHNPHYQRQFRTWKAPSYLGSGTINAINPARTVLTRNETTPAWTNNQFAGMVLIPDLRYLNYTYRILSNDNTTITIDTSSGDSINAVVQPNAGFAVVYGMLIKEALNGRPVKFFQQTGQNSFADGDATIDGVCQVCHANTASFNAGGALEIGTHPAGKAGTNCTTECHSHTASSGGFRADCSSCHGSPPVVATLGGPDGLAQYTDLSGTNSNNQGKHQKHAVDLAYPCTTCHTGYVMPQEAAKTIDIGFTIFGVQGGSYVGQNGVVYTAHAPTTASSGAGGAGDSTCSNLYCHSTVQSGADGTGAPTYASPKWLSTEPALGCGSCHKNMDTDPAAPGSHKKHAQDNPIACAACHNGYTETTTAATHVDNSINLSFSGSGAGTTYSQGATHAPANGYGSCSTSYCHSSGQAADGTASPLTYGNPTWGGTLACGDCHKNMDSDATAPGKHKQHAQDYPIACATCHNGYTETTVNAPTHNNGSINLSFTGLGTGTTYSQGNTDPLGDGYGTCSTLYCHSQGQSTTSPYGGGPNTVPGWATASLTCEGCHNYDAAATNKMASGSHTAHVNDGTIMANKSCDACHVETTSDGTSITDKTKHVNGAKNVGIAGTYDSDATPGNNWNSGTSTCSNVYCHSTGEATPTYKPIVWSATISDCKSCHNYDVASGTIMATGSHTEHVNNAAVIATNYGCQECHNTTTTNGTSITTPANHIDKTRNVSMVKGGTWTSPNCTSAYCHSTGQATPTYVNPPAWGNATDLTCDGCHGTEGGTVAGEPAYANGSQPTVVENNDNSHSLHVTGASDCTKCHTDTVTAAGTAIKAASTLHTNQTRNINFAAAYDTNGGTNSDNYNSGAKTCSAVICHGNGTPQWGNNTTNHTCTKCHGNPTAVASYQPYKAAPGADGPATGVGGGKDTAGNTGTYSSNVSNDPQVGAHNAHLQSLSNFTNDVACSECHAVPANPGDAGHFGALPADLTWGTLADPDGPGVGLDPSYNSGTGQCSNVYCHGRSLADGLNKTPTWSTQPTYLDGTAKSDANCDQCHGSPPPNAPGYDHAGLGVADDCSGCHGHNGNAGVDLVKHINGIIEATGGACNACHAYPPYPGDGMVKPADISPEGKGAHVKHVTHLEAKWVATHPGDTLNASTDTFGSAKFNFICGACHNGAAHTMGSTNVADRTISIDPAYLFSTGSPTYNGVPGTTSAVNPKTCSNASCHFQTTPYWQNPAVAE